MVLLRARSVPLAKEFAMTPLRLRMMEDMQVRNLSRNTQDCYLLQVSQFARHFAKSPALLGPEDIHAYQVYLTNEKKLAPRSVQVTVAALRFLYRVTLGLDWDFDRIIPCPKAPKTLAVILSPRKCCTSLAASRASNTRRS
jgi:site-specific recombinase XerD